MRESPFRLITGFTVSIVTNELSVILLFVMMRVLPVEFVAVIENVMFPLVSVGKTVVVNVAVPGVALFIVTIDGFVSVIFLPSMIPVKLPRSLLSASRVTVMILLAFAKLLPEELAIFSVVTGIGFTAYTLTVLVTSIAAFPNGSAFAE